MKTKRNFLTTTATTAIVGMASVVPAQAASFGTGGISFYEDTTVKFELVQTYGGYKTDLRVYEAIDTDNDGVVDDVLDMGFLFGEVKASDDANGPYGSAGSDPLGTAGNAVVGSPTEFTFEAGKNYTLGIENYGFWQNKETSNPFWGTVYSTSVLNENGSQQAVFGSTGGSEKSDFDASLYTEGDPFAGLVNISFDDRGNKNDADYQDFTLNAVVIKSVPEPTVLLGLGVVAGGMFLTRRNKSKAS